MTPEQNSLKLRTQFEREQEFITTLIIPNVAETTAEEYVRWLENKIGILFDVFSANSIKDNNLE